MHDPRVGRFFARDPLAVEYPYYSPYAFSGNRVIDAIELKGLEPMPYLENWKTSDGYKNLGSYGDRSSLEFVGEFYVKKTMQENGSYNYHWAIPGTETCKPFNPNHAPKKPKTFQGCDLSNLGNPNEFVKMLNESGDDLVEVGKKLINWERVAGTESDDNTHGDLTEDNYDPWRIGKASRDSPSPSTT